MTKIVMARGFSGKKDWVATKKRTTKSTKDTKNQTGRGAWKTVRLGAGGGIAAFAFCAGDWCEAAGADRVRLVPGRCIVSVISRNACNACIACNARIAAEFGWLQR